MEIKNKRTVELTFEIFIQISEGRNVLKNHAFYAIIALGAHVPFSFLFVKKITNFIHYGM